MIKKLKTNKMINHFVRLVVYTYVELGEKISMHAAVEIPEKTNHKTFGIRLVYVKH